MVVTVARVVPIVLSGLARGGELRATLTLTTVHPRCIDYDAATVIVDVDGEEILYQAIGITERSALANVATWVRLFCGDRISSRFRSVDPPEVALGLG